MRNIRVPDVGLRRALQPADIEQYTPLFATLQRELQRHIATLHLPAACSGHFALCPGIKVHTVPSGAGTRLKSFTIIEPGITYGSDLWMPMVNDLIERLRQRGVDAFYDDSTICDVDLPMLQVKAAVELEALRDKLAGRRTS